MMMRMTRFPDPRGPGEAEARMKQLLMIPLSAVCIDSRDKVAASEDACSSQILDALIVHLQAVGLRRRVIYVAAHHTKKGTFV